MADYEAHDKTPLGPDPVPRADLLQELSRLEMVGDLHFHAAAYTTALDYYGHVLVPYHLGELPTARALGVLRKALTACLHLGWAGQADQLLDRARYLLLSDRGGIDAMDHAPAAAPELDEVEEFVVDIERARFQVRHAALLMLRGEYQASLEVAKRAFTVLALTDQHLEVANLQLTMGACQQRLGRLEKAEELYLDSLGTYRRVGDETGVASLHNALALVHKAACRWDKSLSLLDRAVELATRNGSPPLLTLLHLNRGIVLIKMSRFAEAQVALDTCLRFCRNLGDRIREPKALLSLGRLDMLTGRLARAEEHILAAQNLAQRERMQRETIIADEYLGDVMLARGDWERALVNYDLGLQRARRLGRANDLEGELLRRQAEARRLGCDLPRSMADAHAAVAVCEECGEQYELGFCHLTLARSYAASEDWDQADAHFRRAIGLFQAQNLLREWCDAVCGYLDARLATADKPVLLHLRRLLLDVQDEAAAAVSDDTLATCLAGLARVQLRLGLCDDALLTVFELERVARGLEDAARLDEVARLRQLVDAGLVGAMGQGESPVRALSGIPGLFQAADTSLTQHLGTILRAACERMQAASGFLALNHDPSASEPLAVVARRGLDGNLCEQLARWFKQRPAERQDPLVFSHLSADDSLMRQVPALAGRADGCLFLPIAMHQRQLGLLFLGLRRDPDASGRIDQASLGFLASYMGFVALFLAEKLQPTPAQSVEREPEDFDNIITCDERMLEMLDLLRKVADSDLTVLLRGETGTGKGLLAYALHRLSPRAGQRFQSINCAAIPENLLESELFGHVKGSFTGADRDKTGLLVEAEGGTVFLDEIGKMSLAMQGKLLHFLDSRVVRPVGATSEQTVDVRIVCASKADIGDLVQADRFLEDLYFRLLDFPLTVPPLRERPADIPLLARHFVQAYGFELCGGVPDFGTGFLDALAGHGWPGNIRELEKCLRRALVLARGEERLRLEHLPRELTPFRSTDDRHEAVPLRETLAAVESREIARAVKACQGNKAAAARLLAVSYPNLLKKIRLYGIAAD